VLRTAGIPIAAITDHTVTHSIYVSDPDGNEIELYVDVPDMDWRAQPELINSATPLDLCTRESIRVAHICRSALDVSAPNAHTERHQLSSARRAVSALLEPPAFLLGGGLHTPDLDPP
jgi:hypothetical protein